MASQNPHHLPHPVVSYLPVRALYQLLKTVLALLRLPVWLLKSIFPSLRPHPGWTFRQSLLRNFVISFVGTNSTIGITETLSLEPGTEGARWATVQAADDALYVGPLLSTRVRPATVGGTWYGLDSAPTLGEAQGLARVCMHIHGGAFVTFDGRTKTTGPLGERLVRHGGFSAVFAPQYRLAGYGGRDPFPAALQDCLSAYVYLVRTLGIPAAAITLSGDSAGGNLAIGLLRYLERFGGEIGVAPPGTAVLVSPWVAPPEALRTEYASWSLAASDILPDEFLRWGARAYAAQSEGWDEARPSEYIQPLGRPFRTRVPLLVTWGEKEILSVGCAQWAEEMGDAALGNEVVVNLEARAPHDTLLIAEMIGWEESAEGVARAVKQFVDDVHHQV